VKRVFEFTQREVADALCKKVASELGGSGRAYTADVSFYYGEDEKQTVLKSVRITLEEKG